MKKAIALSMVFFMILSLCSCQTVEQKETKIIQVTAENFEQYFFIDVETKNYEKSVVDLFGLSREVGSAECCVTISPKVACTSSNVTVELLVFGLSLFWADCVDEMTINVPSSGTASKSITFFSDDTAVGFLEKPVCSAAVDSVAGSITIEE